MGLHKAVDDEWTSTGVKSTFTIQIPESPGSAVPATATAICGWGWRFSCSIDAASASTSPRLLGADSSPIPWRRVAVYFHPDLIRNAAYGRVSFRTQTENLLPLDHELFVTEFDLPDNGLSASNPPLGVYMHRSDVTGPATIAITVQFPAELGMALPRPRDARVEAALAETIRGEEVFDIKFYAYTRAGDGYVARPRPMFAKMTLLHGHSDAFDTYLSGVAGAAGFAESKLVDLDDDTPQEEHFTEYDYMSDSDLDADSDDEERASPDETIGASTSSADQSSSPPSQLTDAPAVPQVTTPRRMGRVVIVKGHAFKTWNALLYYLYTKKIVFRTLNSRNQNISQPPECSAKSMYKLADKFELNELKALALQSLRSQLCADHIVREAFSTFTSMFPEIQDIEVDFLVRHLPNLAGIDEMLRSVCDGAKPESFDVLRKIVCRSDEWDAGRARPLSRSGTVRSISPGGISLRAPSPIGFSESKMMQGGAKKKTKGGSFKGSAMGSGW
ncbi:hypothetical protein C8R45DRAFT_1076080 [Mycena sanguinolenta]|nr:hypothetical protein C8R45DRAFT_1076080 [Mycena sanguinolenta]